MNGKIHTANVDNFRDMLKICPKLLGQKFKDPPFEEEILPFIRDLGHTGEIKVLSDVNVNHLHQPWRSFDAIINKCLSRKTIALESLRLSRAQILWGMYHNKRIDYVYLLWEDFVYQVENKNSKKNNDMLYPRFTKVIIDYFMAKDPSISRRNKMYRHTARDDSMFTTIRVISKHQDTQIYGAILPQHLTNQAMLESESYKTYRACATGEKTPKPKSTKKKADSESSPKLKPTQASKGKRIKTSAKGDKPATKKQPATRLKGLTMLSEVALTEAEQMEIALKRSKTQQHNSLTSGSSADERTGVTPGFPIEDDEANISIDDEDDDNDDDDDDTDDDDSERTQSDSDGDEFIHPKLTTFDEEETHDEKQDEEVEGSDQRIHTPSQYESTDDEADDEVTQGYNVEEEKFNDEMTNEEEEANDLYKDVNVNLEGRDIDMTDAPQMNVQAGQTTEATHVIIPAVNPEVQQQSSSMSSVFITNMLIPNPDTGIDSVLNVETTSLVDVPQTNQYATALSSIPNIVDNYLGSKLNDAVDVAVQLKFDKLREDSQMENQDFINNLDAHTHKIIKEQVKARVKKQVSKILPKLEQSVNDHLEAELLTRSSNEAQTSHAIATKLSELELKKILMDKMEMNKYIDRSTP
ncbi:hypothetical protein Tco_0533601 [Tanacetum coccineum]